MINCQAWEQQLLKSLPWGSSRNPTWTRCRFSESTSSKPKNSQRATDPRQKIVVGQLPRLRFQGSGLKVLGSWSHAISSASYLPTHTTQAIWSKAMLPKGNLVRTTFKAMSKCSVPRFKGEHSLWNATPTLKWHLCEAIIVWYIHPLILIAKSPSADSLWWIAMVIAHIVVWIRISLHPVMSLYIYVWINDEIVTIVVLII